MKRRALSVFLSLALTIVVLTVMPTGAKAAYPTDWIWPASTTSLTQGYSSGHTGVDIAVSVNTPLYAVQSGTIYKLSTIVPV